MGSDIAKPFERIVLDFFEANISGVIDRTDADMRCNEGMLDLEIEGKLYIECTVANKGESDDDITWEVPMDGKMYCVPDEVLQARIQFAYQRIASRLYEKQQQFIRNQKRQNNALPRIVGITVNLDELSHEYEWDDTYEDVFWKLLWDNGSGITVQTRLDGSWYEMPYKDGRVIQSSRGAELKAVFNNNEINFNKISAILFVSPSRVRNAIEYAQPLGIKDMFLCINKFAETPITEDTWQTLLQPRILAEFPYTKKRKR